MTYVTDPRLTCGITSGRVFLLWFSITFGAIILSCYSRFSSAMSSSSTVGIVGSLLADLLRTFGYSSTSFFSLLGFSLKSYFPFWRLVNAFLWVFILFLRRRALSFFGISGFGLEVLLFDWDLQHLFSGGRVSVSQESCFARGAFWRRFVAGLW